MKLRIAKGLLYKRHIIAAVSALIAIAVLALIPYMGVKKYYIRVLTFCMIYASVASCWNIIAGYAGAFSFGFQALFGLGAYVSALLSVYFGWSPWLTMWIGAVVAMLVGSIVAIPSLKLRQLPYICIATMCMGEIIRILASNMATITRGELGLSNIPKYFTGNNSIPCYYMMLIMFVMIIAIITRIVNSPMGMSLRAIKYSQDASESLGINISGTKVMIYMIGAFMAGAVGAFYAHYINILTPTSVIGTSLMTQFVAMCLLGGLGTIVGPIVGAFTIEIVLELLRKVSDYRMIVYALLIITTIIFLREGIWGSLKEIVLAWANKTVNQSKQI